MSPLCPPRGHFSALSARGVDGQLAEHQNAGVYIAHSRRYPADADPEARCRCKPSWRARRANPVTGKPMWSKTTKDRGEVLGVSVMSGKHAERADAAWRAAGLNRITLHECRHTYASLLMAAGYTIKELMEYMGHADLQRDDLPLRAGGPRPRLLRLTR